MKNKAYKLRAKRKTDKCRRKLFMFLETNLPSDFQTQKGKWNVSEIARQSKLDRATVKKYLLEYNKIKFWKAAPLITKKNKTYKGYIKKLFLRILNPYKNW